MGPEQVPADESAPRSTHDPARRSSAERVIGVAPAPELASSRGSARTVGVVLLVGAVVGGAAGLGGVHRATMICLMVAVARWPRGADRRARRQGRRFASRRPADRPAAGVPAGSAPAIDPAAARRCGLTSIRAAPTLLRENESWRAAPGRSASIRPARASTSAARRRRSRCSWSRIIWRRARRRRLSCSRVAGSRHRRRRHRARPPHLRVHQAVRAVTVPSRGRC